jgi:hypothetical protein
MLETDKLFAGSIPEDYDRYMVPLIFGSYAADLARRAASLSPGAVLETAAGGGVVTRALAPMIETRAEQSRASSPRLPAVAYCQGTFLRNEIEARDAGKLESATDYVASPIADRHGRGEIAAKIQAHVIMAVV